MLHRTPRHRAIPAAVATMVTILLLAACGGSGDTARDASPSTDAEAQLAAAAEAGPYAVGLRTVEVTDPDQDGRTFPVDVWYPVTPQDASGVPAAEYSFVPGLGYTSEISLAEAPAAPGPFPLVIYSHGSDGFRWVATNYTEFLASRGFVVAAPDHPGNTALDVFTGTSADRPTTTNRRPQDVAATIDALLAASDDSDNPLGGRIDGEHIAVTGHSLGGFTALASASGHTNEVGSTAPDRRVDVVVGFAPASSLLSDAELSSIDVPTLLVSATRDTTTPIDPNTEGPWERIPGRPLLRVDITDAVHNSFVDVCQLQDEIAEIPDAPEFITAELDRRAAEACSEDATSFGEVQRLTNAYTAAFLASNLLGSSEYADLLSCQSPPPVVTCMVKP
jgi:predicted dienelactone hydrolase